MNTKRFSIIFKRIIDLALKSWSVILACIERPGDLPRALWWTLAKRAFIGDLVHLLPHRQWILSQGIHTIVDIGSNEGQFASAIGALLPSANLYCFEPQSECIEKLTRRFYRRDNFQAFQVALGRNSGVVEFWQNEFTKSSSPLRMDSLHKVTFPWTEKTKRVMVDSKALDDYFELLDLHSKVFMKIDVQGYELEVLGGGREFLRHTDIILVETSVAPLYEGQAFFNEVYDFLVGLGFVYHGNIGQKLSPLDGSILQLDALFLRSQDSS